MIYLKLCGVTLCALKTKLPCVFAKVSIKSEVFIGYFKGKRDKHTFYFVLQKFYQIYVCVSPFALNCRLLIYQEAIDLMHDLINTVSEEAAEGKYRLKFQLLTWLLL